MKNEKQNTYERKTILVANLIQEEVMKGGNN